MAHVQPRNRGFMDRVADRDLAGEDVVGRMAPALAVDPEAGRGIALRIEIDNQDVFADGRERGAEIDGGRGLADAPLLVARTRTLGTAGRLVMAGLVTRSETNMQRLQIT